MVKKTYNVEQLSRGWSNLPGVLKQMGFKNLRAGQEKAIQSIMSGSDTILLQPTGSGKSATYIIPTVALGWKTVVFSPLKSLIIDQWKKLVDFGLNAGAVSSSMTKQENMMTLSDWEAGHIDFLLVAPERIRDPRFNEVVLKRKPNLSVIDECHAASMWGYNFRESYQQVGPFVQQLNPDVVLALSATMTRSVVDDVKNILGIHQADFHSHYYRRDNLKLKSRDFPGDHAVVDYANSIDGSVIIYFSTVKALETFSANHARSLSGNYTVYHGQMNEGARESAQTSWMRGDQKVVLATKAFGLGIDKPDVRGVIHYNIPDSLSAAAQEAGRGGRDGGECRCMMFSSDKGLRSQKFLMEMSWPPVSDLKSIIRTIKNKADAEGYYRGDNKLLFEQAGVDLKYSRAVMSILQGAGVLERNLGGMPPARAEILGSHPDKKWQEVIDCIENIGYPPHGAPGIEFPLEDVADALRVGQSTVKNKLRSLEEAGYIRYFPPKRINPIRVINDADEAFWEGLRERRVDAERNLNLVVEYTTVVDEDKHAYLEDYFEAVAYK